ncbi:MAG: hypothetical protein J3Q66DRAFT_394604 [Benniella sp.]|nr:MAG: hypothetical protein J3Q66DRAFT_394604 [Benniella sp.]
MKVLSASLCVMAALCLTVQAAPEEQQQQQPLQQQVQQEPQTYFGLALQRDDARDIVSEFEYRGAFLSQSALSQQPMLAESTSRPAMVQPLIFPAPNCTNYEETLKSILPAIPAQLDVIVSKLPVDELVKNGVSAALSALTDLVTKGVEAITISLAQGASVALEALKLALGALATHEELADFVGKVVDVLTEVQDYCQMCITCSTTGGDTTVLSKLQQVNCNSVADVYRSMVKDSIKTTPAIEGSASEDMKRAAAGSASVLNLMDKSSIASSNENLLAMRPVFAGNLLDQYRQELIHLTSDEDEMKPYAETNLGLVINMSNALEACLRVAADPATAAEEFAEESDFLADEDDWEDEDEEEDD